MQLACQPVLVREKGEGAVAVAVVFEVAVAVVFEVAVAVVFEVAVAVVFEVAVAVAVAFRVPVERAVTSMPEADKVRRLFERSAA
jgi:hypothetical protein